MQINITYEPNAKELAKASSLFIEKKPFMLYSIGFINIFAALVLLIILLKLFIVHSLAPSEWLATFGACLWLFARRRFNEWLLFQRMKDSFLLNAPLTIDVSLNGIAWSGKHVRSESMKWSDVKYVIEAKNGFLLPSAFSKFLWLPFRGFESVAMVDAFRRLILDKDISHKLYPRWEC